MSDHVLRMDASKLYDVDCKIFSPSQLCFSFSFATCSYLQLFITTYASRPFETGLPHGPSDLSHSAPQPLHRLLPVKPARLRNREGSRHRNRIDEFSSISVDQPMGQSTRWPRFLGGKTMKKTHKHTVLLFPRSQHTCFGPSEQMSTESEFSCLAIALVAICVYLNKCMSVRTHTHTHTYCDNRQQQIMVWPLP